MGKMTFAIIGSGWRARFFIRIAKFYNEKYEVAGVLCRSNQKVEDFKNEYGIFATTSEAQIINKNPDFVIVAVSKPSIAEVSNYWRDKGFTVLCETPAGNTKEELIDIYNSQENKAKLVIAEQYQYYPTYKKIIDTINAGLIGEPQTVDISLAHEYHGASLLRAFLKEAYNTPFRLLSSKYDFPVTKTGDRYYIYTDGEIKKGNKVIAHIEFADGKVAVYNFESEQYHSLIRHNSFKVSGTRGEIMNEKIWYLNEKNEGIEEKLFNDLQAVRFDPFSSEFSEDEAAIEVLMEKTYLVSKAQSEEILKWQKDNLNNALTDAYFTVLLNESRGDWIESEKMPWM